MGFTSQDDLINQITVNGKYVRADSSKTTAVAHTAAGWHSLALSSGNPSATAFPGTSLQWMSCDANSGDGVAPFGIPAGAGVLSATKHILNVGAMIASTVGSPWQMKLVDMQGYYALNGTDVTGTGSRTLTNSNTFTASSSSGLLLTYANDWVSGTKVRFTTTTTLPTGLSLATDYWLIRVSATTARVATSYANYVAGTAIAYTDAGTGVHTLTIQMPRYAKGAGCLASFVVGTQPTAGGPSLSASSYTNSAAVAARAFQGSPSMGATADAYAGRVLHSGIASGRYGAFLPMQGADAGVASVESFTFSGGTAYTGAGVLGLCIARPLVDICLPANGMLSERDLVNQLPSMPQVMDGACLQWMLFGSGATGASAQISTNIDFAWGG